MNTNANTLFNLTFKSAVETVVVPTPNSNIANVVNTMTSIGFQLIACEVKR